MYKIIGADQKEYGSISASQMRQWIREGRVNAQTIAQAEGDADWKPISNFPEFADALGAAAPASVPGQTGAREAALERVNGPAIGLMVTAILGFIAVAIGLVINVMSLAGANIGFQQVGDPQLQKLLNSLGGGVGIVQDVIGGVVGVVILIGATRMRKLESHSFAFTASILAMVPCLSPCCLLGLPFGIWALVVLSKPEVKSHFS